MAVTRVDEEQFGAHEVSVDELPFEVSLPAGWIVREEPLLYTLVFDEGATGSIQIAKDGETSLTCEDAGAKKYCTATVNYPVALTDKGMSAERRAEAEEILVSVNQASTK